MKNYLLHIFCISVLLSGCTEPYVPELKDLKNEKILIVEGYINADGDSEYTLGYIAPVYKTVDSSYTHVSNAQLSITEENGSVFNDFTYSGNSRYVIHHPALLPGSKYRLRVVIGDREYLSEYVPLLVSPEIENVSWKQNSAEGIRFYVDTRGGDQEYYRWEYEETWRFRTPQRSLFIFDGDSIRQRTEEEHFPSFCYRSQRSSVINLHTTELQQGNTIKDFNIHFIPNFSEKLDMRYSILVKQYALTKEAFGYWNLVKKNSEGLGDIFGTMPTELVGNITCISHPGEKVIGMIEGGKISEKRIFLNYNDLPVPWVQRYDQYGACLAEQMIPVEEAHLFFSESPIYIPMDEFFFEESETVTHYTYSVRGCLDCSGRGSKEPPLFWEN